MLGERPYQELPFYLHSFDVCLLPFQRIPLTLATNPVKVYEYLCAGKEVVCTDLPEVSQFGTLVHKAADHDAFIAAIRASLEQPGGTDAQAARQNLHSNKPGSTAHRNCRNAFSACSSRPSAWWF